VCVTSCNNIGFIATVSLLTIYYITGVVPIIRCPRGNAAEVVAEALDKKIRENLRDTRNSMFTGDNIPVAQLR